MGEQESDAKNNETKDLLHYFLHSSYDGRRLYCFKLQSRMLLAEAEET